MARILLMFVIVVAVNGNRHHPKFPAVEEVKLVACNMTHEQLRNDIIEKSKCGEPKEVFQELKLKSSYLQVTPSSVWVKRCQGLCDFEAPGSQCVATSKRIVAIPVRILNVNTRKESCSMYNLEVHDKCGCCASSEGDCEAPRVYDPRKCSCQCPNKDERWKCLGKRSQNMRWNRSKCLCERRRKRNFNSVHE